MKIKILLGSVVAVLILGVVAAGIWWERRPQVIVLSGGIKLTLLGTTYGKHHVAPKVKVGGARARGGGARMDSTNDTLVVWIEAEHKANQYPNFELLVSDQAATACVTAWARNQSQVKSGVELMGFMLDAFPRRDRRMLLRVMSYGPRGQNISKEQFVVANPGSRSFAQWTPDPLPNTQSDGDLDVTLTKLVAGAPSPYNRNNGTPKNDPANLCAKINFDAVQNGHPATNWNPIRVDLTDATGNHLDTWINGNYQDGQIAEYIMQSALWPDEPAWKMRLEMSRSSGFSDNELWTVTDVPIKAGSQQDVWNGWNNSDKSRPAFAEATVNGIHLKLFPAIQYQDQGQGGQNVSYTIKADPDPEAAGLRLTVLKADDDQGHVLQNRGASWGGGNYQYQYSGVRNLKTLNLTFALHKSRFVEFTVKPSKPAAASNP